MKKNKTNKSKNIILDENLKNLLKENNITLTHLANKTGLNKSTLHNYCNGVRPRCLLALVRISEFFDISLDELIFKEFSQIRINNSENFLCFEISIKPVQNQAKE